MTNKAIGFTLAVLGMAAFLFMVKLMHDMSAQMTIMTTQITRMAGNMEAITADVHGMRASMDRMTAVVHSGSQQLRQMNPMEMMPGMTPGARKP